MISLNSMKETYEKMETEHKSCLKKLEEYEGVDVKKLQKENDNLYDTVNAFTMTGHLVTTTIAVCREALLKCFVNHDSPSYGILMVIDNVVQKLSDCVDRGKSVMKSIEEPVLTNTFGIVYGQDHVEENYPYEGADYEGYDDDLESDDSSSTTLQ